MEYDFEVVQLSKQFYYDHPKEKYPELMIKPERPYTCLLIDVKEDYFICIPFRSHINHNNAYFFKRSKRSRKSKSGLDYSKIVLVNRKDYLTSLTSSIDYDEYKEALVNMDRIAKEALKYIQEYREIMLENKHISETEFKRKYEFTSLKYFTDLLL